tara:strand:- start:1996 stop:2430 length:435 start_codon:yes stop_codon:yes gene_type:complete
MNNIPDSEIYWEDNVRRGKKLDEKTDWVQHRRNYTGITKEGFFADSKITYAGYIDPNNPNNSYVLSIYPYLKDRNSVYLNLSLSEFILNPQTAWESAKLYEINQDGTYTYVWGGNELYDVTDLVLGNTARFKFLNWNETPFKVK